MSDTLTERWDALIEVGRRFLAEQQFDRAEEAYAAALRCAESFGDDDPRMATTLNGLARVYCRRDKYFPAAALLHRLLGIKERALGRTHPELGGVITNLAEMYARLGDAAQELALRERALEIRVRRGDADHVALAGAHERIAQLRRRLAETGRRPTRGPGSQPLAAAPFGVPIVRRQAAPPAPPAPPAMPYATLDIPPAPVHAAPRPPVSQLKPLAVEQAAAAAPKAPTAPVPLAPPAPDVSPELQRQRQAARKVPPPPARARQRALRRPSRMQLVATAAAAAIVVVAVAAKRQSRPAVESKPVYSVSAEGTVAASGVGMSNDAVIKAGLASLGLPERDSAAATAPVQPAAAQPAAATPAPATPVAAAPAEQHAERPHEAPAERTAPLSRAKFPSSFPDVNAVSRSIEQSARARVDSIARAGGVKSPSFARPRVPAKPEF